LWGFLKYLTSVGGALYPANGGSSGVRCDGRYESGEKAVLRWWSMG